MRKSVWLLALIAVLAVLSPALAQQNGQTKDDQNGTPSEQAQNEAPKIMGTDEAPVSIPDKDVANYPTNSSLGYKGVVMANFNAADANDELYADFGSTGLWYYNNGNWTQVSGLNPEGMISATMVNTIDDELIVDFGATGLWLHDGGTTWIQLSGVNAQGMFAVDDDLDGVQEIQVDFGTIGIWRNDAGGPSSWEQYSGLNPYYGLKTNYGNIALDEGTWTFDSVGMWALYQSGGSNFYRQLTGTVTYEDDFASADFTSLGSEDIVADFASLGLWLWKSNSSGWVQISPMSANRVKEVKFVGGSQDYELLAEDNAGGLYWGNWNGSTFVWTLITNTDIGPSSAFCETFDYDGTDSGDEEVIIPWTAGGAVMFDYSAGSSQTAFINTGYFVKFVVKGDYYNRGHDSTLAVAFTSASGQPGLWLFEKDSGGSEGGWHLLSSVVPDGVY